MGCYNKLYMTMPVESIEAILAEKDKEIERLNEKLKLVRYQRDIEQGLKCEAMKRESITTRDAVIQTCKEVSERIITETVNRQPCHRQMGSNEVRALSQQVLDAISNLDKGK